MDVIHYFISVVPFPKKEILLTFETTVTIRSKITTKEKFSDDCLSHVYIEWFQSSQKNKLTKSLRAIYNEWYDPNILNYLEGLLYASVIVQAPRDSF